MSIEAAIAAVESAGFPHWVSPCGTQLLVNADCLQVLPLLPEGCVDALITDPMYGVSIAGGDFTRTGNKGTRRLDFFAGDSPQEASGLALSAIGECLRLATKRASVYVWCGHRQFGEIVSLLEANGLTTRFVVWSKLCPCPAPPGAGWPAGAELCIYAFRSGRTWNPRPGEPPFSNVLRYDSYRNGMPGKVPHPTQKPLEMIEELIGYSTVAGDVILDPFVGSGTTSVACVLNGRSAIGIEIDTGYFDIAVKRVKDALGMEVPSKSGVTQLRMFAPEVCNA